jgi:hypothetical protein
MPTPTAARACHPAIAPKTEALPTPSHKVRRAPEADVAETCAQKRGAPAVPDCGGALGHHSCARLPHPSERAPSVPWCRTTVRLTDTAYILLRLRQLRPTNGSCNFDCHRYGQRPEASVHPAASFPQHESPNPIPSQFILSAGRGQRQPPDAGIAGIFSRHTPAAEYCHSERVKRVEEPRREKSGGPHRTARPLGFARGDNGKGHAGNFS